MTTSALCERYHDFLKLWPKEDRRGEFLGAQTWISLVDIGAISEASISEVFAGLERWKLSEQWRKGYIQAISNMAGTGWLQTRAWMDTPKAAEVGW